MSGPPAGMPPGPLIENISPEKRMMAGMNAALAQVYGERKGLMVLPVFLGGVFDFILLGVLIVQFHRWLTWVRSNKERRFIIGCVSLTMVAALAQTIFNIVWQTHIFVWNFGTYIPFVEAKWISSYALIDVITTLTVQTFYAERSFRLNKRAIWALLAIVPFMIVTFGGTFGTFYNLMSRGPYTSAENWFNPVILGTFYMWNFGVLCTDIGITASMAYGLHKSRTGWARTDSTIHRLLWLSLETQLPALISAIAIAVTYSFNQSKIGTTIGVMFEIAHPKIYAIGLLAMLNYRFALRIDLSGPDTYGQNGNGNGTAGSGGSGVYGMSNRDKMLSTHHDEKVHVSTEVTSNSEYAPPLRSAGINRQASTESANTFDQASATESAHHPFAARGH